MADFVHIDLNPQAKDFDNLPGAPTVWRDYLTKEPSNWRGLGWLPIIFRSFVKEDAKAQIAERYAHGGGYKPFDGFTVLDGGLSIQYPGDPPRYPLIYTTLDSGEVLTMYEGSWLMIKSADGASYEIVRMD